jgi:hypothetical protein
MKVIVHDLNEQDFSSIQNITKNIDEDFIIVNANDKFAHCVGCYGCWFKTPGTCKINDDFRDIGALLGNSEEMFIISRNTYGGYSEQVKKVFDRSVSGSTPFFTFRSWKLKHTKRYGTKNRKRLIIILYGDFLETETKTAELIAEANRSNMGFKTVNLHITKQIDKEIGRFLQ